MNLRMKVGPLLGVESNVTYTVCFLSDMTITDCDLYMDDSQVASFRKVG